jgi:tetratricopeptide (TPR) repeat protein
MEHLISLRRPLRLALIVVTLTASAHADEDAKALFDHGAALFALHKFAEAAAVWEQAFEHRPDAAMLFNAAQAHRLAGNKARALELYQSLVRMYGDRCPNRGDVEQRIVELRAALAKQHQAEQEEAQQRQQAEEKRKQEEAQRLHEQQEQQLQQHAERQQRPDLVAPEVTRPAPRPLHRRAWFWGVTVGGVAVIAGAIATGVVLGTAHPHQLPDFHFGGS